MRLLPKFFAVFHQPPLAVVRPVGLLSEIQLIETELDDLSSHVIVVQKHVDRLEDGTHGCGVLLGKDATEMWRT